MKAPAAGNYLHFLERNRDVRREMSGSGHRVEAGGIRVIVEDGKLTLEGDVASAWQKNQAENIVSGLSGVRWIENKLNVVPSRDFEDRIIAEEISRAVDRNPLIDAEHITVRVTGGVVTYTGVVSSAIARRAAEQIALHTAGVREINNELLIAGAA